MLKRLVVLVGFVLPSMALAAEWVRSESKTADLASFGYRLTGVAIMNVNNQFNRVTYWSAEVFNEEGVFSYLTARCTEIFTSNGVLVDEFCERPA